MVAQTKIRIEKRQALQNPTIDQLDPGEFFLVDLEGRELWLKSDELGNMVNSQGGTIIYKAVSLFDGRRIWLVEGCKVIQVDYRLEFHEVKKS